MKPIIKWAGGKRQLLSEILPRLPEHMSTYIEPFVGGGAVFFALATEGRFDRALLGDANTRLVNMYNMVKYQCSAVLECLEGHASHHSPVHFYEQRALFSDEPGASSAARFIYLNRTCFNGLYRVNRSGVFNVPFGSYKNPRIVDRERLENASAALSLAEIWHVDYSCMLTHAGAGDVAYLDPPYLPVTPTASFAAYHQSGFGLADHRRLDQDAAVAAERGAIVLLSNSDTPDTRAVFSQRSIRAVAASRNVNCKSEKRGKVSEILVSYEARA